MNTISGVYKITNAITNDFYIGSSKDVKRRWREHKCKYSWNKQPNNPMYLDFQKYGVDKFEFEILAEVESEQLKETEQEFIELLKPSYNSNRANGWDTERYKEYQKEYNKSDKRKEYNREYQKSEKGKESNRKANRKYYKSDKGKESKRKYDNQLCSYNGETLTLCALRNRFRRQGLSNPTTEAKKYLLGANND